MKRSPPVRKIELAIKKVMRACGKGRPHAMRVVASVLEGI